MEVLFFHATGVGDGDSVKKLLPKKTWLRRTLIATAALLSAPFIVSGGLWLWLDQDDYKARLSAAVEARTGRPLLVGDLRVAVGLTPRLYAEDIRYPNPDWASSPYAIQIKRAAFAVDLFALVDLFGGKLLLRDVMLEAPVLKFERNADGAHNFALKKLERKSKPPMDVTLTEAAIIDGAITIQTRNREWNIVVDGARAHAHAGAPVTLSARGSVEEVAVDASATFAELKTLLAGAPSPVSVSGVVGGEKNFVTAGGDAENLFKWHGVNLNLNFDIARLDAWSKFYRADATLPAIAFTGGAKLKQPARLGTLALSDINFTSQHGGLTTRLTGGIKRAFYRDGFDLAVAADGTLTPAWLSAWPAWVVGVGGGDGGGIVTTAAGAVTGSSRDLQLTVTDAVATAGNLTATSSGAVNIVDGRWQGGLPVSFDLNVDAADAPAWLPSPSSPLTASASLLRKQGRWHLHDLALDAAAADASLAVTGGIHDLTGAPSATLAVAVTADDLPVPAGVPPLTDLAVTADLAFGDGARSASVSAASANLGGVALTAAGEIHNIGNDIADTVDAELEVTATLADASALTLPPPATALLGALTPLTATALVTAAAGDWRVDDLRVASDADGLAAASLTGGVGFAPLDAKLRLHADGVKVADLPAAWNIPRPDGGVVDAKATLTVRGDGDGGVAVGAHGIDLHLTAPAVAAEVHGDIDRWRPLAVNNLTATLTADSVGALNWPAASRWQPDNAVKATLTLAAGGARRTDAEFEAVVGDNDLRGRVNWRRGDDDTAPPRVEAELIAARIELTEIFTPPPKREKVGDADDTPTPLSATPFNTDWLRRLDGRLHLVAGEAGGRWFSVNDLRVQADAGGGVLRNTVAAKMGDGDLALSVKLDAGGGGDDGDGAAGNGDEGGDDGDDGDGAPLSALLNLRAAGLATDGLRAFRRREFLQGGTLAADIKVAAAGASMRDLAEAADGHLRLRLDRARIKNQALDIFGGDLFTNLVTAINPFRSLGEFVEVECAMVTLAVGGGVAGGEDALAVKTDQVTLLGGGEVRLADGELDFLFSPKARKGLGINPSSIAKIVRLGGSVGAPRIVADPGGLVETGVVAWATAVTGGLALLAKGLLDRNRANADICGNGGGGNGAPVRDAREG